MKTLLPKKGKEVSIDEIRIICADYHLYSLWAKIYHDPPKKVFVSDGCSCWPDTWNSKFTERKVSIYDLCFLHDLAYWCGYNEKNNLHEQVDRFVADTRLVTGVVEATGDPILGESMWLGIRSAGVGWLKLPFSWGFGRL